MGWAAIIQMIMMFVIPLVEKWIESSALKRLKQAALGLPDAEVMPPDVATLLLLDTAIAELPRRAFGRRIALRRLRSAIAERFATGQVTEVNGLLKLPPATEAEVAEARDFCGLIDNE